MVVSISSCFWESCQSHVTSEIAAIEELRRAAGVSGQSTQRVYVDSRRTLYSRIGDCFSWLLVGFTGAGLLAQLFQTAWRALRPRL
jgi:apolipoprotein N-acyltransferase